MRPVDIITFDCYGTLIDWETGIVDSFRNTAEASGDLRSTQSERNSVRLGQSRRDSNT